MPQLQPFWDAAYTVADPGPYVGLAYAPNAWDTAKFSSVQLPGIVTVQAARTRFMFVYPKPANQAPTLIPSGYEPLLFTVSVKLWTPAHWAIIQPIMWSLMLYKGSDVAFDVAHPFLAAMSIRSAICKKLGPITGGQEKTLSIELMENRRGKSKVFVVDESVNVNAAYNAEKLAAQSVQAQSGRETIFSPTNGPQQKPSQAGVTLTATTP